MTDRDPRSERVSGVAAVDGVSRRGLLVLLSRRTSSGGFIPVIDGLRFVAIALVVLTHVAIFTALDHGGETPGGLFHLLDQGTFGVNIFFVISGFILALPFAGWRLGGAQPVSLRRYYLRRVTRLEPPYMFSLFALAAVAVTMDGFSVSWALPHLAAGLGYAHNAVYGTRNPINGVAWTLEIEIQFYLVMPALAVVYAIRDTARRRAVLVAATAGAIALYRYVLAPISPRFELTVLGFLAYFLVGFLVADLYLVRWQGMPKASPLYDLVWIVGAPLLLWDLDRGVMSGWIAPALTFVLFVSAFRGALARRILGNPWIYTIGGMCYSIYLLHFSVIQHLYPRTRGLSLGLPLWAAWLVQLAPLGAAVMLVSALYFVLIERPCMSPTWPQTLRRRIAQVQVVPRREALAND